MDANTFITIPAFLRLDFGLKGNELLVAALVYGFSQNGSGAYFGGIDYIADWTGAERTTVIRTLQNLTERGVLMKTEITISGNCKRCSYQFNTKAAELQIATRAGCKMQPEPVVKCNSLGLQNATRYNNIDNIKDIKDVDDNAHTRATAPTTTIFKKYQDSDNVAVADIANYLKRDCAEWLKDLAARNNFSTQLVALKVGEFTNELRNAGVVSKTARDCRAHFWNWLRKNVGTNGAKIYTPAPAREEPRASVAPEKLQEAAEALLARRAELLEQYKQTGDIQIDSVADGMSVYSLLKAEGYLSLDDVHLPTAEAIKRGFERQIIKEERV